MFEPQNVNEGAELPEAQATPARIHRKRRWLREAVGFVVLFLLCYTPLNLLTTRAYINGPSMQPNFYTGQFVIINRSAYIFNAPQRGDIIVLHNPNHLEEDDLFKRVIGLPGESVDINDGVIRINGIVLAEPYIKFTCDLACDGIGHWTLGPNQYFVLGDNRANSYDSRSFGPIDRDLIVGEAMLRYWPLDTFNIIDHPKYSVP